MRARQDEPTLSVSVGRRQLGKELAMNKEDETDAESTPSFHIG
jgi:hypothetical protein